ncbi:MAG: B12-binding domain-containing radical SAM protein [Pseudomonadota bacterium]
MNALLVYPRFPLTYWGFQHGLQLIGKQASLPPLGLITLAALLPDHWHLRLVDLNAEALWDEQLQWADVVLLGGLLIQVESMHEVIARAHALQVPVAVGGPAPTTSPELFADADVVFRGEAEGRIPALVDALERASCGQITLDAPADFPDMKTVPVPRFELLDLSLYASMSVQFSRGCPYRCEFCDIIEIFGRTPRVKTSAQMLGELEALYRLGFRGTLFFVDDNFIGNKKAVRSLLPLLLKWQGQRGHPFALYTEASVDLASEPGLLRELAAAGFTAVFVGIESPSAESLAQAGKHQNLRLDLADSVRRITSAGIEVMGGFIVGFDSDGEDIFDQQWAFLDGQPIPLAMVGTLTALPGTALWRRLDAEGRLRGPSNGDPFTRPNFVPAMREAALLGGYAGLLSRLYTADAYYGRCQAFMDLSGAVPGQHTPTRGDLAALARAVWHIGLLSPRRGHFWRLMVSAARRGRAWIRQAVVHAVRGEHLIRYTWECVVPRLERALADLRSEAACTAPAYVTVATEDRDREAERSACIG